MSTDTSFKDNNIVLQHCLNSEHKSRTETLDGSYILPPIGHSDGQCYMKIGHHGTFEQPVASKQQLEGWYQGIILQIIVVLIFISTAKEVGTLRQFQCWQTSSSASYQPSVSIMFRWTL